MSRAFRVASLAIVLCAAPAVAADPPPIITARLEYEAAQGCPAVSVLRAEFARRQGHDPFDEVAPLRVVATIAREKGALAGSVKLYDSADKLLWTRPTTPAMDCQTVVLEMAGALAVRLDPKVYLPAPVVPAPPKPTEEPPPVRVEPQAEAPAEGRVVLGLSSQLLIGAAGLAGGFVGHLGCGLRVARNERQRRSSADHRGNPCFASEAREESDEAIAMTRGGRLEPWGSP